MHRRLTDKLDKELKDIGNRGASHPPKKNFPIHFHVSIPSSILFFNFLLYFLFFYSVFRCLQVLKLTVEIMLNIDKMYLYLLYAMSIPAIPCCSFLMLHILERNKMSIFLPSSTCIGDGFRRFSLDTSMSNIVPRRLAKRVC